MPDVPTAGRSSAPLPSILRCDRPMLSSATAGEIRSQLHQWLATGTTVLAHTPQSDLRALGFDDVDVADLQRRGCVVDVAVLRLPEGSQVASLKRMAEQHDLAPPSFQAGNSKHCAVQDALVTLALYRRLADDHVVDASSCGRGD